MDQTGVRWRLSVMMFLQYMIWGAWYPVFSAYLDKLGFSGFQTGIIYSLLPIGCMIAPFAGGQLADRYVATEKLLAALHVAGGIVLCVTARFTSYETIWPSMLIWSLLYAPTLALTNSITFHHLPGAEKKFGLVRVFGTLGWIAVGFLLTVLRNLSAESEQMPWLGGADSLWVGGIISVLLGVFCLALPHTPPARSGDSPWAFLKALKLLRDPSFVFFIIVAFVVSTELPFFFQLTAPFLQTIGVSSENIPAVMSLAQIAEIGTMLALPWMLSRWGVRKTMALGIIAWPIRYAIFAYGQPRWFVIAALAVHGVCYVCFFVVAYIYVNSVASPDIRASAQAFIAFVLLGAGMYFGALFTGWVRDYYTTGAEGAQVVDYAKVFLVPTVLTTICALLFFIGFRDKRQESRAGYSGQAG